MTDESEPAPVVTSLDPIARLAMRYPAYEFDTMLTGAGRRYQARARSLDTSLWAVITGDLAELGAVLAEATARQRS